MALLYWLAGHARDQEVVSSIPVTLLGVGALRNKMEENVTLQ